MLAEHGCTRAAKAPAVQKVPKTVEVSQLQYIDEIIDEPVQMTVDVPQVQFADRAMDVPVVSRRHVPGRSIWEESVEAIGVVDSEDVPLNVCRKTLRQNKILRVVKEIHVTKHSEIAELLDEYKKLYEQCGRCRNHEDSAVGVKTAEVLRFNTSESGGKLISRMEYVDRMKEDQNDVSYVGSENTAVVSSLFEENPRKKGHEVPYEAEPMDEYAVCQFKESDGAKLNPTVKEGLNLGDVDEKKTLEEELKTELEPLTKLMKHILVDKVEEAMVSDRIVDSPCVATTLEYEYGWSAKVERIMETQALSDESMTSHMVSKKTIEVNPMHSVMTELKASAWQQQHMCSKHQLTQQSAQQEREGGKKEKSEKVERKEWETVVAKGRKGQRERGQEGTRKEEEREPEEEECKQVKTNGGQSDRRQSRGRDEADPERRRHVRNVARESAKERREAEELWSQRRMHNSGHERASGRRKAQGQEGQSGEETSHETGASEERGPGDSGERERGRRVVRDGVRANEVGDGNHENVTVDGRRQTSYCGGSGKGEEGDGWHEEASDGW